MSIKLQCIVNSTLYVYIALQTMARIIY